MRFNLACWRAMPAMGSQATAVPAGLRWLLAIPDAIELLEKPDRELLTSDDAEQLFGISKVRGRRPHAGLRAGLTGHILTLPRAELLRQLRRYRNRAAFRRRSGLAFRAAPWDGTGPVVGLRAKRDTCIATSTQENRHDRCFPPLAR